VGTPAYSWRRRQSQDIVHELCFHLKLSTPDLSKVQNLDGYLYTFLRHVYLSDIARSAREALQSVSPDDFDSIQIAFRSPTSGDPLQEQNDLRRSCSYVALRKGQAKSVSYFILRFFHGYFRREIATVAGVPLSTIDPKLNKVRSEVHLYLAEPRKASVHEPRVAAGPSTTLAPFVPSWQSSMSCEKLLSRRAISSSAILEEWEIYASLRLQEKPVDLIYLPDGQHILQKPNERFASQ
jgi:DNA-directed RNA polymerase specialized sigma24 family protein